MTVSQHCGCRQQPSPHQPPTRLQAIANEPTPAGRLLNGAGSAHKQQLHSSVMQQQLGAPWQVCPGVWGQQQHVNAYARSKQVPSCSCERHKLPCCHAVPAAYLSYLPLYLSYFSYLSYLPLYLSYLPYLPAANKPPLRAVQSGGEPACSDLLPICSALGLCSAAGWVPPLTQKTCWF